MKKTISSIFLLFICTVLSFGQRPLKRSEVFDFDIGDEFHTSRTENYFVPNYIPPDYIRRVVTNKYYSSTKDTLYYVYETRHSFPTGPWGPYKTNTSTDTTIIIELDSMIIWPLVPQPPPGYAYDSMYIDTAWNNRIGNSVHIWNGFEGGTDWKFVEGLGGGYGYDWSGGYEGSYLLLYYKKGTEEWGEQVIVGIEENESFQAKVKLYPNPSSGTVAIDGFDEPIHKIEIVALTGEIIERVENVDFKRTFTWNYLPPNIYLLNIIGRTKLAQTRWVKIE